MDTGKAVAQRRLQLEGQEVSVTLFSPERVSAYEHVCEFTINGIAEPGPYKAHGVDSMQALYLALESIRQKLKPLAGRFTWLGRDAGDTSFPPILCQAIGPEFTRHLEEVVKRRC